MGNYRHTSALLAILACCGSNSILNAAQGDVPVDAGLTAVPRETVLGTVFLVRPAWDESIKDTVASVRSIVRAEKRKGKAICYVSTPLSSRGGGHRPTNVDISRYVKRSLESRYGKDMFWALAPGVIENELPVIGGERPGGGEYLYMWTQILAGEGGEGPDFDMVYFVGPTDVHAFFGIGEGSVLDSLASYVAQRSESDAEFRDSVGSDAEKRRAFLRYYGIRASASFSTGALDEWNVFRLVNRRRSIGEQVAFYFDGRQVAPSAAETSVQPGYEQRK